MKGSEFVIKKARDLRGGQKTMFLKHHRDEILSFWQANGDSSTMAEFNMQPHTLNDFLLRNGIKTEIIPKAKRQRMENAEALSVAHRAEANAALALEKLNNSDYGKWLDATRKAEAKAGIALQKVNELESLIKDNNGTGNDQALLIAQIAKEASIQTKARVENLEEKYGQFIELIADQLTRRFFIPLLKATIQLPSEFNRKAKENPLSLTGLDLNLLLSANGGKDQ